MNLVPLKEYYKIELTENQLNEAMDVTRNAPLYIKKVLLQRKDSKNRNGRVYPGTILEREISEYKENFVDANRALGELDHTEVNIVNLKNVSHIIKEIYWDGDGCYGDIEILDSPEFPAGRIAAGLLRRKIPVGISSRGMGSVTELDEAIMVNDDYKLLTFDLVSYESTQGSNMVLRESYEKINNKYSNIDSIIHDMICNNSGVCSCMFGKNIK